MVTAEGRSTRDALFRAAERLLEQEGPDGVTTRAVCTAADVKAPTLYHHFGDKNGLLDAVVEGGIATFIARKRAIVDTEDALADLVSGWEDFVDFALGRPQLFRLMIQRLSDNPQLLSAAMATTDARLVRLAHDGRLVTDLGFARSALLVVSTGVGALSTHEGNRSDAEQVARFLLRTTLDALVRPRRRTGGR